MKISSQKQFEFVMQDEQNNELKAWIKLNSKHTLLKALCVRWYDENWYWYFGCTHPLLLVYHWL